jgi:hypothetical protein
MMNRTTIYYMFRSFCGKNTNPPLFYESVGVINWVVKRGIKNWILIESNVLLYLCPDISEPLERGDMPEDAKQHQ